MSSAFITIIGVILFALVCAVIHYVVSNNLLDFNKDGKTDLKDAEEILDVNNDGKVDVQDAVIIAKQVKDVTEKVNKSTSSKNKEAPEKKAQAKKTSPRKKTATKKNPNMKVIK